MRKGEAKELNIVLKMGYGSEIVDLSGVEMVPSLALIKVDHACWQLIEIEFPDLCGHWLAFFESYYGLP